MFGLISILYKVEILRTLHLQLVLIPTVYNVNRNKAIWGKQNHCAIISDGMLCLNNRHCFRDVVHVPTLRSFAQSMQFCWPILSTIYTRAHIHKRYVFIGGYNEINTFPNKEMHYCFTVVSNSISFGWFGNGMALNRPLTVKLCMSNVNSIYIGFLFVFCLSHSGSII